MNRIIEIVENEDIVYVISKVKTNRSISPKAERKADEVIIFGFNKRMNSDLYKKYVGDSNE